MSDNKESENISDIETTVEDTPVEQKESSTTKADGHFPWFWLLLLIIISIGASLYLFTPKELKDKYLNLLNESLTAGKTEQIKIEITDTNPMPELTATPETAPTESIPEIIVETEQPMMETTDSASSEEIGNVLDAMQSLQGELRSLREQQQALEETQHSVQIMQLRTRLRWITNPANHLPQLQLAWEEVMLMPILSSSEHERAQTMLALAEKRLLELQSWQQTLHTYAESLSLTEHANIIPEFENRWLNWVAKQFSLRSSLSEEETNDARLQEQLINASRNIEIERWPDVKTWLQLRATLQLRVIASEKDDETSATVDLRLPESFEATKTDINLLRQSAETWLEDLS
ncbi:MAG: hypothetical protein R8K54_08440 [Mariprofundaceae bacterium]